MRSGRWSAPVNNIAGQVIATDRYWNLTGLVYSTTVNAQGDPVLGAEGVNYYRTRYAYDNQGVIDRLVSPTGTITHYQYDPQRRLTVVSVGTDDTTTTGLKWTPATQSARANMATVVTYEYDNGTIGNGVLTKVVQLPGGAGLPITTLGAYDWRDRLVATKVGGSIPGGWGDQSTAHLPRPRQPRQHAGGEPVRW